MKKSKVKIAMLSRCFGEAALLQTLQSPSDSVTCCDFGANFLFAAGSSDKLVRVWEWIKGQGFVEASYSPLGGHRYAITSVRFSPLGTMLASSSSDGSTVLWNARTGVRIHTFVQTNGSAVRLSIFAPNSTFLVSSGDDGSICVWDILRRTLVRSLPAHDATIQAMSFSPDCKYLLTSDTVGVLKLWKDLVEPHNELEDSASPTDSNECLVSVVEDAHDLGVTGSDFASTQETPADNVLATRYTLATCGNNHLVKVWSFVVMHPTKQWNPPHSPASGSGRQSLVPTPELGSPVSPNSLGPRRENSFRIRDSKRESNESLRRRGSSVRRRHKQCQVSLKLTLEGHGSDVTCVRFNASATRLASSSLDKTVRLWEIQSGTCLRVLEGHTRYVACCVFSRDGSLLASGSNDKSILMWDVKGKLSLDTDLAPSLSAFRDKLSGSSFDSTGGPPDVSALEGGPKSSESHAELREVQLLQRIESPNGAVNTCDFFGNNFLAFGGGDKMVHIFSKSDSLRFHEVKNVSPIEAHAFSVNQVEFSPCGKYVASCSADGCAVLWDTETGKRVPGNFGTGRNAIRTCRFSPDGKLLICAGDDQTTSAWRTDTGELFLSVEGHTEAVTALAISPDSQFLATACSGGHIRGWAVASIWDHCLMLQEDAHDLGVQSCDFSPSAGMHGSENYLLASCGNDSLVKLWKVVKDICIPPITSSLLLSTPPAPASPLRSPKPPPGAKLVRTLAGHGGNVMCVRFTPDSGEFLVSTASDSTARIWSVHLGDCLFVLEGHNRQVTSCALSADSSLLATGSLDKALILWLLPEHLVYQSVAASRLRGQPLYALDWTPADVISWLKRTLSFPIAPTISVTENLDGCQILTLPENEIASILSIEDPEQIHELTLQLKWLRHEELNICLPEISSNSDVPHEFLCPITREVMRDPVVCADGFTYERAAIEEWFLSGKLTSPMTNSTLPSLAYRRHSQLKRAISEFLYDDSSEPNTE
ncbi:uncharacterized WD repeat-containing protein alr3466-like [Frankliniella occidentalis]|uniref:Uncharacterized WD repeat-containing protein alr3466-like n=1 Tax=Frankliniella occidentalis TaxID=133901 RepID=A0A9C6U660_FRAOC|nr:uncharacterized WD repeat-containing protein alr3466-like [Frankliniella occidentalis]